MRKLFPPDSAVIENNRAFSRRWGIPAKNVSPHLAFTEAWFSRYQRGLLWLCNSWLTRDWFRRLLRIENDVPEGVTINYLGPNRVTYGAHYLPDGRLEMTTDFRCHHKFAKRVYYEFEPIWYALHQWDAAFADRMLPELSFGFDTLTVYPDPDPETTTVDGGVSNVPASTVWATIRGAANGTSTQQSGPATSTCRVRCTATTNQYDVMTRGIFLFDTSSIGAGSGVTAATFGLTASAIDEGLSPASYLVLCASNPATNTDIVVGDYSTFGSTRYATDVYQAGAYTDSATYNTWTMNATGRAAVDMTGITKLATRSAYDFDNAEPVWSSGANSFITVLLAEQTGTSTDPKLIATHFKLPPRQQRSQLLPILAQ